MQACRSFPNSSMLVEPIESVHRSRVAISLGLNSDLAGPIFIIRYDEFYRRSKFYLLMPLFFVRFFFLQVLVDSVLQEGFQICYPRGLPEVHDDPPHGLRGEHLQRHFRDRGGLGHPQTLL